MFRKSSVICAVVAMTLLMTSCGIPGKNDSEKEGALDDGNYSFSEIETGIIVTSMAADMSENTLYVLGVEEPEAAEVSAKTIKTIDIKTLKCSEFTQVPEFVGNQRIHGFFPGANGYWVFTAVPEDGDKIWLLYLSADFELSASFDVKDYLGDTIYDSLHIWGSTADGHLLISLGDVELFTLNPEGEKVQT